MSLYNFQTARFKLNNQPITVNINDPGIIDLHKWYENACTAEFIIEHEIYGGLIDHKENIAYNIAVETREKMSDYHLTEEEALEEIFTNININKYDRPVRFD